MADPLNLDMNIIGLIAIIVLGYVIAFIKRLKDDIINIFRALHSIEDGVDAIGHAITKHYVEAYNEEAPPEALEKYENWSDWENQ